MAWGVLLLAAFVALGLVVRGAPFGPDALLADAVGGEWRDPVTGAVARTVSVVFGPAMPVLLAAGLVAVAAAWWRSGQRDRAVVVMKVVALLAACRVSSFVAKPLFARERPRVYPDFSFPSGHVVSVASSGFALVVLCLWFAPAVVRRVACLVSLTTVACAASRIALDVHWLTDTIGSVLAVTGIGLVTGATLRLFPSLSTHSRRGVMSSS